MKSMHIAIFTDSYFPYVSGVTIAVRSQVLEFLKAGHSVSLFVSKCKQSKAQQKERFIAHPNLKIYEIGPSVNIKRYRDFRFAFPNLRTVSRILRKKKPDIVHVHTELSLGFCGKQIAHALDIPLVGTFHTNFSDPHYLKTLGVFKNKLMRFAIKKYQKRFFSMCDVLIVPSHYTYRELTAEDFHPNIVQVSSGIVVPKLRSNAAIVALRRKFQIHNTHNVIVVGRISSEKNIDTIIKAFAKVHHANTNSRLIIIGDGPYTKKLKEIVATNNLQTACLFLGMIHNEQISEMNLFRLGDVYVTTSMTETLGMTTLEAMAQKVLVVGSPQKGLSDFVTTTTAILCNPTSIASVASALTSALKLKNRRVMIEKAYTLAKEHDRKRVAKKVLRIYQQLVHVKKQNAQ